MADYFPTGLLEACVVIGASNDKLKEAHQLQQQGRPVDFAQLDPEVLQVHIPPFVTRENESQAYSAFSKVQRRRSFIKKKREKPNAASNQNAESKEPETEDISVPKDIDLIGLPQLCFPGGLQLASELKEERFHFLVFTDVFGNRTYGAVMQYYKPVQEGPHYQNGHWSASKTGRLYTACAICIISKYAYFSALKDCLSCLLVQLKTCRGSDFEERVKEFAAKLALVPTPPPGQLHLVFNLKPLQIVLPSKEDLDHPIVDLDLHLPFLCFKPKQVLQIITCILTEQRIVFFSSDWALLTLISQCFMLYIHPLQWVHTFVPILSRQMLDFVMAPTSFLMGCHIDHFEEVAAETNDLILINIDNGTMAFSCSPGNEIPKTPWAASECFLKRRTELQIHYDLQMSHLGVGTDINDVRMQRRQWQQKLNLEIQQVTLELIVNIFREVNDHLNYEHRVFNSEEFLKSREPEDQLFYKKVLETHIFHSFLKERLNRKMDAFTRMELNTRSEAHRMNPMMDFPRRPTMQEMARKYSSPENRMSKRLGMSMPNLVQERPVDLPLRQASLKKLGIENALKISQKPIKHFRLPDFPPPLSYHYVQNYYSELINLLGKAIATLPPEDSALLARYFYLRGFLNTISGKRLDALSDFQNLYKTDIAIFPTDLVKNLVDSLQRDERGQAEKHSELKRLISKVKKDNEKDLVKTDDHVKKFELPKKHMQLEDFVKRIQESGIVKDVGTIHRLFEALTVESIKSGLSWQGVDAAMRASSQSVFYLDSLDGQQKQIDPEVFRVFYKFWKETEAEAQDVHLPAEVIEHLDKNECVYKLSCSVKTNYGVGKIAMTQKRLLLLTDGRPSYVEITKFRDIEEVRISSAPLLLLRVPSLKIKMSLRKEMFEANLKSECDLWNLMVKEMWAGRKMADDHKDPQYMQQALTNVLLMDAVVGCLQSQKAIFAANKLAYFDKMKSEVPMMVPKTTSETLKHKINPSLDLTTPQAVDVLLYTPGQLSFSADADSDGNPKLWCALSDGKVVVFDAASWSIQQNSIQVGASRLNCMLRLDQHQVWIGSQDSTIYIINIRSMSCNKQLTEHRAEVTDIAMEERSDRFGQVQAYSCSADGSLIIWDVSTLKVKKQLQPTSDALHSIKLFNGTLWCCSTDYILELRKNGTLHRKLKLPDLLRDAPTCFSSFLLFLEKDQLWTACVDGGELLVWHDRDLSKPFHKIQLPDCIGVSCMIKVKNQVWVGSQGRAPGKARGKIYVVDTEKYSVEKELVAHTDCVQALCSAEDRYVLSGSAYEDGKIAIWKVE